MVVNSMHLMYPEVKKTTWMSSLVRIILSSHLFCRSLLYPRQTSRESLNGLETELSEVPFVSAAASALPATASSDARLTPPASSSQVCEGRRQVSSE